jgi:hypothetical protein
LFDVALRPSSNPVFASRKLPVQTVATSLDASASRFSSARKGWIGDFLPRPNPARNQQHVKAARTRHRCLGHAAGTVTASDRAGLLRHDGKPGRGLQQTEHFQRPVKIQQFESFKENRAHMNW